MYCEWAHLKRNIKRIDGREYYTVCGHRRFVNLDADGNPGGEPRGWCDKCRQWGPWDVHCCLPPNLRRPEPLNPENVWSDAVEAVAVSEEKAFYDSPEGKRSIEKERERLVEEWEKENEDGAS